jgi:hypothetical protein
LLFFFIMVLVLDCGLWGITLAIGSSSNSYWKISSPLFLLIGHCNSTSSSIGSSSWAWGVYPSTTSWEIISTSSSKFEITITHGSNVVIEIIILPRKLKATFNSSSNSLLFYYHSEFLRSFTISSREGRGLI